MNMVELIEKDQYLYECDECGATFKSVEINLVELNNFTADTPGTPVMCVEKDGLIITKPWCDRKMGDRLLSCPNCGKIYPSGLSLKSLRR